MKNIYVISLYWQIILASLLLVTQVSAADNKQGLTVSNGYLRASIPGTDISSAYMKITNKGEKTVTLLRVSSKISPRIEMHQHTMQDGIMRMRQLPSITIDAKSHVELKPSGLHLMIFDLKQALKPDDLVELTLYFSNETKLTILLPVQSIKQHQHHH